MVDTSDEELEGKRELSWFMSRGKNADRKAIGERLERVRRGEDNGIRYGKVEKGANVYEGVYEYLAKRFNLFGEEEGTEFERKGN